MSMMIHTCAFLQNVQSFYIDWDAPSVGVINRDGSFSESKGDFAIKLQTLVEADAKTGYISTVKRAVDKEER